MAKSLRLSLILILLCFVIPLTSQDTNVKSVTVADGLSQGYVPSLIQDSRGFMWFATADGLDRYDGY